MPENDADIMSKLEEIDDDAILGEEVSLDGDLDLDFEEEAYGADAEEDVGPPPEECRPEEPASPKRKKGDAGPPPPAPLPEEWRAECRPEEPASPKRKKSGRRSGADETGGPKDNGAAARIRTADKSTVEIDEMTVHAKVVRIIADKVLIEPNILVSP